MEKELGFQPGNQNCDWTDCDTDGLELVARATDAVAS